MSRWMHTVAQGAMTVLLLGGTAAAEETPASRLAETPAPSAHAPLSPLSAFAFEGTTDGGNATLKYGGSLNVIKQDPYGISRGVYGDYSIALSAPINEGGDFTAPLTMAGLGDAASVTLQLSQLVVPGAVYTGDALEICERLIRTFKAKSPGEPLPGCGTNEVAEHLGIEDAKKLTAARKQAYASRILTYRGVSSEVGYKKYAFYDPTTLAKGELERTPWRVGGFWGWIGGDRGWSATVEYVHQVSFEEATKKTACFAGAGPILNCVTGPLGRAERVTRDLLSVEARKAIGRHRLNTVEASLGVAPKVVYDANNNDWGVALPVYLFGDKSGLTGGVRADWESKDHDIIVGVFLTKTFSISDQ